MRLALAILIFISVHLSAGENPFPEATSLLAEARLAKTPVKQVVLYNEALRAFSDLRTTTSKERYLKNSALAEITDVLNEPGFSYLFTLRALKESPSNKTLIKHLKNFSSTKTKRKTSVLGLILAPLTWEKTVWLLTFSTVLLFAFLSVAVWSKISQRTWVFKIIVALALYSLTSLSYQYYFTPIDAVVVKSTMLYQGPSTSLEYSSPTPLAKASKVEVLDASDESPWIKVRTRKDNIGFVPASSLRLVDLEL